MALLAIWLICVAVWDARHRRVPNVLVMLGGASALVALGMGWQPLGVMPCQAAVAAVAGFLVLLVLYFRGLMGAGDVKFAAALGLWIGPLGLIWVWIGASILAGIHAFALIAWRRYSGAKRARRRELPYAAHMALVAIGVMAWQHRGM